MLTDSPHLYRQQGIARGVAPDVVEAALAQAARVERLHQHSVLSLGHLAELTGVPYPYLRQLVERRLDGYRSFEVAKRATGPGRAISVPEAPLMYVQRWVLHNVLAASQVHHDAYAYRPGRSVVQCARRHLGAKWLLKLDIHDFFHAIDERQVYGALQNLGYQPLPSFEMSRLLTRRAFPGRLPRLEKYRERTRPAFVIKHYTDPVLGYLPQGAPTSGMLSNLVCRRLDQRLAALAGAAGCVYTRYADDVVFSSPASYQRREAQQLLGRATQRIASEGFLVHEKKTRFVPPGARKIVLGLLVDQDRVRLRTEVRRRIETHIFGLEKHGLMPHAEHWGFRTVFGMIRHVRGLLDYAHDVEPEWTAPLGARFAQVLEREPWIADAL